MHQDGTVDWEKFIRRVDNKASDFEQKVNEDLMEIVEKLTKEEIEEVLDAEDVIDFLLDDPAVYDTEYYWDAEKKEFVAREIGFADADGIGRKWGGKKLISIENMELEFLRPLPKNGANTYHRGQMRP